MPEVVDIVRKVAPKVYPNYVNAFAAGKASLQQFAIDTPLRIAHFLPRSYMRRAAAQFSSKASLTRRPRV